jgi:hypothetical protein
LCPHHLHFTTAAPSALTQRSARHRLAISTAPLRHPVQAASTNADPWPPELIPTRSRSEEPDSTGDSTSSSFYRQRREASRSVGRPVWFSTTRSPPLQPTQGAVPPPYCSRLRRDLSSPSACSSSPASWCSMLLWSKDLF